MILGLRPNGAAPRYRSGGGRPPAIERGTLRAGISDNTAALARRHRNHTCILASATEQCCSIGRQRAVSRNPGRIRFWISDMDNHLHSIGGASYSRSSPFGQWSLDVRALGLLRPPWALACHQLFEASFAD